MQTPHRKAFSGRKVQTQDLLAVRRLCEGHRIPADTVHSEMQQAEAVAPNDEGDSRHFKWINMLPLFMFWGFLRGDFVLLTSFSPCVQKCLSAEARPLVMVAKLRLKNCRFETKLDPDWVGLPVVTDRLDSVQSLLFLHLGFYPHIKIICGKKNKSIIAQVLMEYDTLIIWKNSHLPLKSWLSYYQNTDDD